jgi:hypothetical protein
MASHDGVQVTALDEVPYLDRIWRLRSLSWTVRERVLQLHREGVFECEELTTETLAKLNDGGLDEQQGLQLLARYCSRINDAEKQSPAGSLFAASKNSLLQQLLQEQVRQHGYVHGGVRADCVFAMKRYIILALFCPLCGSNARTQNSATAASESRQLNCVINWL